ncbi:MAG: hypothetical protein A2341_11405 [Deltaproteobacteria bacterium RIFOXYB12_FULL_58_9]|nr:MAG: hypothetical protein A2341_11405 [Deltaproteobacteria bacterium RIFOXYB12_FULL_58_9]
MATIRWHRGGRDILSQLDRMSNEMNDIMSVFGAGPGGHTAGQQPDVFPPLNVYNDGECFIVRAEIPGVDSTDLDIEMTGDTLTLRGERRPPQIPEGASYHRRERDFGRFRRSLTLPQQVDNAKVVAAFANGILEIRLPHAESAKRRKVEVKIG